MDEDTPQHRSDPADHTPEVVTGDLVDQLTAAFLVNAESGDHAANDELVSTINAWQRSKSSGQADELPRRIAGQLELPEPTHPVLPDTRRDVLMRVLEGLQRSEPPPLERPDPADNDVDHPRSDHP